MSIESLKKKIKSKLIDQLYIKGYTPEKEVTAKNSKLIDEAIQRRLDFNVIDFYVEALFNLEDLATIPLDDNKRLNWRSIVG